MTTILKQSTQIKVRVGPFVDVTDGFTPETAIGNTPTDLTGVDEAELLKADGAATVDITTATWAAITGADGWYDLTLTTSHTDTVGELVVVIQDDSVCLPVFSRFQIVEEAVYDDLYASSAAGYAGISELATAQADLDTLTGSDGATLATSQGNYAPSTAAAMSTAQADLDTLTGSDGVTLATAQANYAPATAAAMSTAQADLDTLTGTDGATLATAQANYAPATAAAMTTAQADLDTLTGTDGATLATTQGNYAPATVAALATAQADLDTITGTAGAIIDDSAANDTTISDAVWDEARSGHTTQGTYGESHDSVISANVNDASASTTAFVTDLPSSVDDFYNGRVIIFTSGALDGQATDITDYVGSTKTVTVTALTSAPADTVDFIVV